MPDLKIDPTTGDLMQGANGDLVLTDDASGETTAQLVRIALRTFAGEWFLNTDLGVDYFGTILVKNPDLGAVQLAIQDCMLGVPGVAGITSYAQSFDSTNRRLKVTATLQGDGGQIIPFIDVLGPSS